MRARATRSGEGLQIGGDGALVMPGPRLAPVSLWRTAAHVARSTSRAGRETPGAERRWAEDAHARDARRRCAHQPRRADRELRPPVRPGNRSSCVVACSDVSVGGRASGMVRRGGGGTRPPSAQGRPLRRRAQVCRPGSGTRSPGAHDAVAGMSSRISTRVVIASPMRTGRRKRSDCDRYTAPGPGSCIAMAAETKPAVSMPCAMRPPNPARAPASTSRCTGFTSPVMTANSTTSISKRCASSWPLVQRRTTQNDREAGRTHPSRGKIVLERRICKWRPAPLLPFSMSDVPTLPDPAAPGVASTADATPEPSSHERPVGCARAAPRHRGAGAGRSCGCSSRLRAAPPYSAWPRSSRRQPSCRPSERVCRALISAAGGAGTVVPVSASWRRRLLRSGAGPTCGGSRTASSWRPTTASCTWRATDPAAAPARGWTGGTARRELSLRAAFTLEPRTYLRGIWRGLELRTPGAHANFLVDNATWREAHAGRRPPAPMRVAK